MYLVGDVRLINVEDVSAPFSLIRDELSKGFVYGNLEGALSDEFDPYEYYSHGPGFRVNVGTAGAGALKDGNFRVVGLANNAIMGGEPIRCTQALLDGMGIAHMGAGADEAAARAPAIFEHDGVKYGFLQRTSIFRPTRHKAVPEGPVPGRGRGREGVVYLKGAPGVATIRVHTAFEPSITPTFNPKMLVHTWPDEKELAEFVEDIRKLRPQVDVLVTSVHWREPQKGAVSDFRVAIAHAAIDAGADLVASHGTHLIDEVEVYKGKVVFYGLGEFLFGLNDPLSHRSPEQVSLLARAEVRNKAIARVTCSFVSPNTTEDSRTVLRLAKDVPDAVSRMMRKSKRFGTRFEVTGDLVSVEV